MRRFTHPCRCVHGLSDRLPPAPAHDRRSESLKDRRKVAAALKPIYTAPTADAAETELERFDQQWGGRYPMIAQAWRRDWQHITPFLALPDELRRVVYTTNTIEAMHRQIRKAIKTRGHLPRRTSRHQAHLPRHRARRNEMEVRPLLTPALTALKIHFGDRLPD